MMMNMKLEYQITFQDDLDCKEVYQEYQLQKKWLRYLSNPIPWLLFSILFLVLGIIETSEPDKSVFYSFSFILLFSTIFMYFTSNPKACQSYLFRRAMLNKWKKKPNQQEKNSFTITDTEFIFTTDVSELAWKWGAIKDFSESNKGFMLFFVVGRHQYIPKRIFTQEEIEIFRDIMKKRIETNNNI